MSRYFLHTFDGTYTYDTEAEVRSAAQSAIADERANIADNCGVWDSEAVLSIWWGPIYEAAAEVALGPDPNDPEGQRVDYRLEPVELTPEEVQLAQSRIADAVRRVKSAEALKAAKPVLERVLRGCRAGLVISADETEVGEVLRLIEAALGVKP